MLTRPSVRVGMMAAMPTSLTKPSTHGHSRILNE